MSDYIVTVAADNTITLSKVILDSLGWAPGTQLGLVPQADGTVVIEELEAAPPPVSKGRRKQAQ